MARTGDVAPLFCEAFYGSLLSMEFRKVTFTQEWWSISSDMALTQEWWAMVSSQR